MSESSRSWSRSVASTGFSDRGFGRGRAPLRQPDRQPAVEEVDPFPRETVQAHQPVATDRLAVQTRVVVEDDAPARGDAPRGQGAGHVFTRRQEVLARDVARLRPVTGFGQVHVHVHEDGAGQMRPVVDLAVN